MRTEQLDGFQTVGQPHLHPDGVRVAFEMARINVDGDRYDRSIWIHDGEAARRFTAGDRDSMPRWSPSGDRLAFLRKASDDQAPAQVAVMAADGGEATTITELSLGVFEIEWAPSGDQLAIVGGDWAAGWADLDDEERARRPRRITRAVYRFDNLGWMHDRRRYVYLVGIEGGGPVRIGDRDADEHAPTWSPDGSRIAYLATPDSTTNLDAGVDIVEFEVDSGERTVRHERGGWSALAYSPDSQLHAIGMERADTYPGLTSLWRLTEDGPLDMTGHLDRSIWSFLLPPDMAQPRWLTDGDFLIGLEDSGRLGVIRVSPSGEAAEVLAGERSITGFDTTIDAGRIVFAATDCTDPGELFELADGAERKLTDVNAEFRGNVDLVAPQHRRVTTDNGVEVDVWTYLPSGDQAVPVLVNVHGGPASQYGFGFFDEFQIYTGAGYGVVACNPRGSSGRGDAWVKAVTGDGWGAVDTHDVLSVVEAELEREPRLDASRMGLMGGSYGGFLTAWITAKDHRFKSAVVERALLGWESFSGTSDIARDFAERYLDASLPGDPDVLRAASPLTFADQIQTPTLILHSEDDFRCPIEQAEQLFMTLLRAGTEVEFIRFPGEGHELSRSGKPRHRAERFGYILEWHDRLLA